jgi:hypothetical protein
MRLITYFSLFILSATLFSCSSEPKNYDSLLPGFIGFNGEMVVVMSDAEWKSEPGRAIQELFYSPYEMLPQIEAQMDLEQRDVDLFHQFYKKHRTVILADIRDNLNNQTPQVKVRRDVFSRGQLFIEIIAKDANTFKEIVESKGQQIVQLIQAEEFKRIQQQQSKLASELVQDQIETRHGVGLLVTKEYQIVKDLDNFVWLRRIKSNQNPELDGSIFIYSYPYTSDSTFTLNYLVAKRDSVLGAYVRGSNDQAKMATELRFPPKKYDIEYNGAYAAQVKGLWKVAEDFQGGPFTSISFVDTLAQRIVCVEGLVYAPHEEKREHMRDIESLIRTAKVIPPSEK